MGNLVRTCATRSHIRKHNCARHYAQAIQPAYGEWDSSLIGSARYALVAVGTLKAGDFFQRVIDAHSPEVLVSAQIDGSQGHCIHSVRLTGEDAFDFRAVEVELQVLKLAIPAPLSIRSTST